METNEIIQRITKFVNVCSVAVTVREVCGGTGLPFDTARELLPLLAQNGILRIVAGFDNLAQYTLPSGVPVLEPPKEPYIHPETKWSNEQRARAIAEYKRAHPNEFAPVNHPSLQVTDEEIQRVIDAEASKPRKPLTAEDERWLNEARSRRTFNPQEFLK